MKWEIREYVAASWRKEDMPPEMWDALSKDIAYWEKRTIEELNRNLYPYPGARDEAAARLDDLCGP
jgi:hypothetical protein